MQKYLFMKKSLNVLAAIVLSGAMLACSSDDSDGNSKTIRLRNHTESGCKDFASLSNITQSGYQKVKSQFDSNIIERVSLKGNKKGTLSIFHENATFPCEAEFTISVDVSESTIIVHEDAPPTTNCICHLKTRRTLSSSKVNLPTDLPSRTNSIIRALLMNPLS